MANTSGSKIEASNRDFNTLLTAIFNFLNDTNRTATTSTDSKITSYSFKGGNNYPHNINSSQSETVDSIINNSYASSLNIIYDIIHNNYMKTSNLSTTKITEYKTTGNIIPALDQHMAIVNYWNNNGSSACNGACVGYCIGNCADNESKGVGCNKSGCTNDGSKASTGAHVCASLCTTACTSTCTGNCYQHCDDCTSNCDMHCANGCNSGCQDSCSIVCTESCKNTCSAGDYSAE